MSRKALQGGVIAVALLFVAVAIGQAQQESQEIDDATLMKQANSLFAPIPEQPPELKNNPLTPEKIDVVPQPCLFDAFRASLPALG